MHHAILNHGCAQNDAAVHVAIGGKIPDAAGIGSARFGFQFGDNFAGADLWRAAYCACRKASKQRVDGVLVIGQFANHIRDDVHHMAVKFDHIAVGYGNASALCYSTDVVAAEIEQHQMFGALLWVGE